MSMAKEIRSKIVGINSTKKITSAMEMVAASKLRKAQDRMCKSRPYTQHLGRVISHIANSHPEYRHPLLKKSEIKRVGYIVVSSDRGLCGGLNVNVFREAITSMQSWQDKNIPIDLCPIGVKAGYFFRRVGGHVVAQAEHLGERPQIQDLLQIVKVMLDAYREATLNALFIVSNKFISSMKQVPVVKQLLPIEHADDESKDRYWDYIYEPDNAQVLLDILLQRYIESQFYQAVVENIACEQASRMIAMQSATDNTVKLIDELQLAYNKARQATITAELAEIVAGAAAV